MAAPNDTALFPKISHPHKRALLAAYAATGRISHAATVAGVSLRLHYYWRKLDAEYNEAWLAAQRMVGDLLEEEAVRRARDGVTRTRYFKDQPIATETEYSDTLLIFLLKGAKPDQYRDNVKIDHQVSGEVTLTWSDRLSRAHTALEERRNGHPLPA